MATKIERVTELESLLTVAREQMERAKELGLRSLQKSLRYDIRRWKTELEELAGDGYARTADQAEFWPTVEAHEMEQD